MSLLSKLFGGKSAPEPDPVAYEGFQITPQPIPEGRSFRLSARVEKDVGGTMQSHTLIRADTFEGLEAATEASIAKAKQMIDEQGDRLFD